MEDAETGNAHKAKERVKRTLTRCRLCHLTDTAQQCVRSGARQKQLRRGAMSDARRVDSCDRWSTAVAGGRRAWREAATC